jgi:hypothetical protein
MNDCKLTASERLSVGGRRAIAKLLRRSQHKRANFFNCRCAVRRSVEKSVDERISAQRGCIVQMPKKVANRNLKRDAWIGARHKLKLL